jgi:putative tryptophan/tyrosine transport system substrate-binding protein
MRVVSDQSSVASKEAGAKTMSGKILIWLLTTVLLTAAGPAEAQQPAKVAKIAKIGFLRGSFFEQDTATEILRGELRALGYVEGKNIAIEYRSADNKFERFPALVDEMVRLKVDVLIVSSTAAALAAKNATRTIPIIVIGVTDSVAAELVDSLARPGGNITGFTSIAAVLSGKRLELLKETVSKISRVALLWNPQDPASAQQWKESLHPARELGLQLHSMEVRAAEEYDGAFKEAIKARILALAVPQDSLAGANQKQIVQLAAKYRLPAIYSRRDFVENGGLMSYGPDRSESFRRVASMVDKILKGTKPADIPVEQPRKFELVINLKTAKQIGLTITPNVLTRADRAIK